MPRSPQLRAELNGRGQEFWVAKIKGKKYTFGKTKEVSRAQAQLDFAKKYAEILDAPSNQQPRRRLKVSELTSLYLTERCSEQMLRTYTTTLRGFCRWKIDNDLPGGGQQMGTFDASRVGDNHLHAFERHYLKHRGNSSRLSMVTVKGCYRWAAERRPPLIDKYPFSRHAPKGTKRTLVRQESEIITEDERAIFMKYANVDFRFPGSILDAPDDVGWRKRNPWNGFKDFLFTLLTTGARPGELCYAEVGHITDGVIILHRHKNAQKKRGSRRIALDDETAELFERLCEGKNKSDKIFVRKTGPTYKYHSVSERFAKLRQELARTDLIPHDKYITMYSFRHLFATDALRAGVSPADIAVLMGNSVQVIMDTYAAFLTSDMKKNVNQIAKFRKRPQG